jgi:drug/metabolite transporter (DMT)-like permease
MKWLFVFIIVASNATGDLLNAYGMRRQGHVADFHPSAIVRLLRRMAHNRFVLGGIAAMAVGFFALLALLSIADLSFAVPATAASFLLETLLAKFLLREEVHWQRWLGALLVACGVALLALE